MLYRVFIPLWAVCLLIAAPTAQAVEIYSHSFGGDGTVPLNGLAPDVDNYNGGGNLWLAGTIFLDDGTVGNTKHGAAILPFVPVDGSVYTLEANILPADTTDTTGWIAIGFLENDNDGDPNLNVSRHSNAGGWAWQTVRNTSSTESGDQVAFPGRQTNIILYNADRVDATVPVATKTILDTTGGAGNWTAEFFLNGVSQEYILNGVSQVGPVTLAAGASNIQFVGFSQSRGGAGGGKLNSFALSGETVVVPGDFNGSGIVDAADYVLWRDSLGHIGVGIPADGNSDQIVDIFDYEDEWKPNFGAAATASGSQVAVPEPTGICLMTGLSGAALLGLVRQRAKRRGSSGKS